MKNFLDNFYNPKVINQRIIKSSKTRLIVSGSAFEMYSYSQAYHYNFPPLRRPFRGQSEGMVQLESNEQSRRESNLAQCRQRLRRLIDANVDQYGEISKFITITFKENETILSRANKEFGLFIKRFNYQTKLKTKYLAVVEFQKRGAIHYHVIFFNLPYIDNIAPYTQKIWGLGNIDVKALSNVKNIGAYVTKYLQKEVFDARLASEKAFFCAKGLNQPVEYKNEEKIAKFLGSCIIETITTKEYRSGYYGDIIYSKGFITIKTTP